MIAFQDDAHKVERVSSIDSERHSNDNPNFETHSSKNESFIEDEWDIEIIKEPSTNK